MTKAVICASQLGKRYRIDDGAGRSPYKSLRESIVSVFNRRSAVEKRKRSEFWALKEVSFTINRGDVVGVIGRNGAGKSTLLKILARITEPTEGYVDLIGRVGSLLEVGTGFHPELTGRENIFLNGAILGMRRAEIARKFDAIVDFAEVEKFINTPVKHYSSGMAVRLAFAVAAHLEPEILLVDEVLAVGDAAFQKKCLGKMGTVAQEGRTVVFVSHNMHAVAQLCPQTLLLEQGRILNFGRTADVISQYLQSTSSQNPQAEWAFSAAPGGNHARLRSVSVLNSRGECAADFEIAEPIIFRTEFWILNRTTMTPSFHVYNSQGILLFAVGNMHDPAWGTASYDPGLYESSCTIPGNLLNEGRHYITIYLTKDNNAGLIELRKDEVVSFQVNDSGTMRGNYTGRWEGLLRPIVPWNGRRLGDIPTINEIPNGNSPRNR